MSKCIFCQKELKSPVSLVCEDCFKEKEFDVSVPNEVISTAVDELSNEFIKADSGKLEWSLVPFRQMEEVVKVLMNGARKYSVDNWKKCDDIRRYKNSLMRHVVSYIEGEKIDDITKGGDGLSHLAHAICNCLFLMYFDDLKKMQTIDEELRAFYGSDYKRVYNIEYQRSARKGKHRYSKQEYINPSEKIAALKEKYKNGVNINQILEMLS